MDKTTQQIFSYLVECVANCDDALRKTQDVNEAVELTEDRDHFAYELVKHVSEHSEALLAYFSVNSLNESEKPSSVTPNESETADEQAIEVEQKDEDDA